MIRESEVPETMHGVLLTGHGGLDMLEYRDDLDVPVPDTGDVLIRVLAAGVNNTDINTRTGWYSKRVADGTGRGDGYDVGISGDASWSGEPLTLPRIQGADCYGEIVAAGRDVDPARVGERVLVRTMLRDPVDFRPHECWTFGSECDGAFAQYTTAPAADVFAVDSELPAEALGAIPCAYGTAEGMLVRAAVRETDHVLVTGASGGVGSALVQLAKLRGATVTAIASFAKHDAVRELGADRVLGRDADVSALEGDVTVVADLVGGDSFAGLIEVLARGGRYVTAGAIAGPIVPLDLRTLYLNDLSFYGCAAQEDIVFENIVRYLADGTLRPRIAGVYPLHAIREAQQRFVEKDFVGKIVLVP